MIKRVLGAMLVVAMGVACTEKRGDDNVSKPLPDNGKHYVKSIDMYEGDPEVEGGLEYCGESIEFELDNKNRITRIMGKQTYNGGVDTYADTKLEYDNSGGLMVKTNIDGEEAIINCELNDRGAITSATYTINGEAEDLVENFIYNKDGELTLYSLVYAGIVVYSLEYEWRGGNIVKITSEDLGVADSCTYTDEPNPYNIDTFFCYAWEMPILCEFLPVHDGFLGNINRSMLKSYSTNVYGDEIHETIIHKFKNGLVDYTIYDDVVLKYKCF